MEYSKNVIPERLDTGTIPPHMTRCGLLIIHLQQVLGIEGTILCIVERHLYNLVRNIKLLSCAKEATVRLLRESESFKGDQSL